MGEGWQIFKIRGIPLRIHPSWFVILVLATAAFQQQYSLTLKDPMSAPVLWGLGLVTAMLLFVSVLLHELGHSLVALAQGVEVRSITLFLLGGVASVERECSTARGALLVAAAGPAVSLVLGVGLLALGFPQVLGVGYDTIEALLGSNGGIALTTLLALLLVKLLATGLSSATGFVGGGFEGCVGTCQGFFCSYFVGSSIGGGLVGCRF